MDQHDFLFLGFRGLRHGWIILSRLSENEPKLVRPLLYHGNRDSQVGISQPTYLIHHGAEVVGVGAGEFGDRGGHPELEGGGLAGSDLGLVKADAVTFVPAVNGAVLETGPSCLGRAARKIPVIGRAVAVIRAACLTREELGSRPAQPAVQEAEAAAEVSASGQGPEAAAKDAWLR